MHMQREASATVRHQARRPPNPPGLPHTVRVLPSTTPSPPALQHVDDLSSCHARVRRSPAAAPPGLHLSQSCSGVLRLGSLVTRIDVQTLHTAVLLDESAA